jgi:hypothetical protein
MACLKRQKSRKEGRKLSEEDNEPKNEGGLEKTWTQHCIRNMGIRRNHEKEGNLSDWTGRGVRWRLENVEVTGVVMLVDSRHE